MFFCIDWRKVTQQVSGDAMDSASSLYIEQICVSGGYLPDFKWIHRDDGRGVWWGWQTRASSCRRIVTTIQHICRGRGHVPVEHVNATIWPGQWLEWAIITHIVVQYHESWWRYVAYSDLEYSHDPPTWPMNTIGADARQQMCYHSTLFISIMITSKL